MYDPSLNLAIQQQLKELAQSIGELPEDDPLHPIFLEIYSFFDSLSEASIDCDESFDLEERESKSKDIREALTAFETRVLPQLKKVLYGRKND